MSNDTTGAATSAKATKKDAGSAASPEPIVIDLGKKSRKQVRKLRKGEAGRLMDRVEEAIEHLRDNNAVAASAQPIVIVIKEKQKRRRGKRLLKPWGLG